MGRSFDVSAVEQLEPRLLMSGNVSVVPKGSNISITGDEANQQITLTIVDGKLNVTPDANTSVGGGVLGQAAQFDIPRNMTISMGEGDDSVTLTGVASGDTALPFAITGKLTILAGGGHDTVDLRGVQAADLLVDMGECVADQNQWLSIGPYVGAVSDVQPRVARNLTVSGGSGNDRADIYGIYVGGNVSMSMGDGSDIVYFNPAEGNTDFDMQVRRNVTVTDASVHLDAEYGGGKVIVGGSATFHLSAAAAGVTADADTVTLEVKRNFTVKAESAGETTIRLKNAVIGGKLMIQTGASADTISILGTHAKSAQVKTAAGADNVTVGVGRNDLWSDVTGKLLVDLGDDADTLSLSTTELGSLLANAGNGGDDNDTLVREEATLDILKATQILEFEVL